MSEDEALQNRYWIWAAIIGVLALPFAAIGVVRIWRSPGLSTAPSPQPSDHA